MIVILCVWALEQRACFAMYDQPTCEVGMAQAEAELGADFEMATCQPTNTPNGHVRPQARKQT